MKFKKRKRRYSESFVTASKVLGPNFEEFRNKKALPVEPSDSMSVEDKRILAAYLVFCLENRSVEDETPLADSPEDILNEETYEDNELDSALSFLVSKCNLYSSTKWIIPLLKGSFKLKDDTTEI